MSDDDILTVVTAHRQGKKIQAKSTTSVEPIWLDCCDPMFWNFEKCDYRVAPEPQRFMKGYCFPCYINETATIGMIKVEQVAFGQYENPIGNPKPREWIVWEQNGLIKASPVPPTSFSIISEKPIHVREVIE